MKKIIFVALMFGTLISYANEKENRDSKEAKKTVKVEFNNVKKGQTLSIKNAYGLTVYNNEIKNSGSYSKTFDFSALKDGIYTAELNKDFEIIIKNFYIKNGFVTFLNNKNEKVFKPVIRTSNDLLYVTKLGFEQESVKISIHYNDEVILSETVKSKELKRAYKLSIKKVGNYKIIVNSNDRTYIKEFTL